MPIGFRTAGKGNEMIGIKEGGFANFLLWIKWALNEKVLFS